MSSEPGTTEAWERGAAGERLLARAVSGVGGIHVLNDRRVAGTNGNIDHIVIGPPGVFVVDTKDHHGQIRIVNKGGLFRDDPRLYVGRRDCSRLASNMDWQVAAVRRALGAAELSVAPPVVPVLCFVDVEWPLFLPPTQYAGVLLEDNARSRSA